MKYDTAYAKLIKKEETAENIFDFVLECPQLAEKAKAGQFAHIAVPGKTLRRPISICDADERNIRIVFQIKGEGTEILSKSKEGDLIDILAPLGHGFDIPKGKRIAFVGGGIGVPPMLFSAKQADDAVAVLGFRNKKAVILTEDFKKVCSEVFVATDDGSFGIHGFTSDILRNIINDIDMVCACGPMPMLKVIAEICKEHNKPCQVSLEERMGCGIGACLVCACKTLDKDGNIEHSHVCKKGPVYNAEEVVW
ncbi:MAG: dihydroorotate dehydrogenase electron transfer subunit [Clostridia bacterium]|nr:dihydroorotate dehydrogenase electron transfer subunit [Clostridia bacterium]